MAGNLQELTYHDIPGVVSGAELEDREYTTFPGEVAEWPPPIVVTGSIVHKPGGFNTDVGIGNLKYKSAAQRATIFYSGNGEEHITPAESSLEAGNLPDESQHELPVHAAIVMVTQESPSAGSNLKETLKSSQTYKTTLHQGLFASPKQKAAFRQAQIGIKVDSQPSHRRLTADQLIGDDGVTWD